MVRGGRGHTYRNLRCGADPRIGCWRGAGADLFNAGRCGCGPKLEALNVHISDFSTYVYMYTYIYVYAYLYIYIYIGLRHWIYIAW